MKRLLHPNKSARDAYITCVSGIGEGDLKARMTACCDNIVEESDEYIAQAERGMLFSLPQRGGRPNENPVVVGAVLKSELVNLYDYYMVQKKPARDMYDDIMVLANGHCPFCGGIGRPKTLDHYLPKAKYPQFSVLPLNLIPSCKDCNLGEKRASVAATADQQVLHPYLDDNCFFTEQWIFARVFPGNPCSLEFYVFAPDTWSPLNQRRVNKHFVDFDLSERYSILAGEEIAVVVDQRASLMRDLTREDFTEYLMSVANPHVYFANHWRRVLYQTLARDEWFCSARF
jgi:hypothetical protein